MFVAYIYYCIHSLSLSLYIVGKWPKFSAERRSCFRNLW